MWPQCGWHWISPSVPIAVLHAPALVPCLGNSAHVQGGPDALNLPAKARVQACTSKKTDCLPSCGRFWFSSNCCAPWMAFPKESLRMRVCDTLISSSLACLQGMFKHPWHTRTRTHTCSTPCTRTQELRVSYLCCLGISVGAGASAGSMVKYVRG